MGLPYRRNGNVPVENSGEFGMNEGRDGILDEANNPD
jgi:hypothetical protein